LVWVGLSLSLAVAAALAWTGCSGLGPRLRVTHRSGARAVRPSRIPHAWAGAIAGVGTWAFIGGFPGVIAGVVVAALAPLALSRLEPAAARARRVQLTRDAPLVADLLGAAMLSGVTLDAAIPVLARAFAGSTGEVLDQLSRRLALGMEPALAWSAVAAEPGLGILGRAAARSARTGAPLAEILLASGDELRSAATAQGLADIRSAGVAAVLPLGLCLLPAFVLLGIVPVVAGLIPDF
jgi:hypothetical protein